MILVMYANGRTEMVPQENLEEMIEAGSITKFRRDGRWAKVGRDMMRRMSTPEYVDDERRDSPLHH